MTTSLLGHLHVSRLVLLLLAAFPSSMVLASSGHAVPSSSELDNDLEDLIHHRGPGCLRDLVCLVQKTIFALEVDDGSGGAAQHEQSQELDCLREETGMIYSLDLPQDFMDSHPYLDDGLTRISISDACVNSTTVTYPSNATITILPGQRRRLVERRIDSRASKNSTLAVVWVETNEFLGPRRDTKGLVTSRIWDDHEGSIRSQFRQLSFGKMDIQPGVQGPGIDSRNAIYDLHLPINIEDYTRREVENILARVGSFENHNDFVMYCLPKGTKTSAGHGWSAYAVLFSRRSLFNDGSCGGLFTTMHELGHNLGLDHSNNGDGHEYRDSTCYMGRPGGASGSGEYWPQRGYNAAKNWWLEWYADRHIDLTDTLNDKPWSGRLVPFVDYDKAPSTDVVIIKVGVLYIQYNRARDFNIGQGEKLNEVTIAATYGFGDLNGKSKLVAGLKPDDEIYRQRDVIGDHDLVIELCERVNGREEFDYAHVSIFLDDGIQSSQCSQPLPALPSGEPSMVPTTSTQPTTSDEPSAEPSSQPSSSPSSPPLDCTGRDDTGLVPVNRRFGNQTCAWIAGHKGFKSWLCQPGFEAFERCQGTCDSCNTQHLVEEMKAKQTTSCEDVREMVQINDDIGKMRCFFLGQFLKRSPHWKSRLCAPSSVHEKCRETCGTCTETCHDSNSTHLFYTNRREGGWQGCEWLSSRPLWQAKLCDPTSRSARKYRVDQSRVDQSCPDTCNSCDQLG